MSQKCLICNRLIGYIPLLESRFLKFYFLSETAQRLIRGRCSDPSIFCIFILLEWGFLQNSRTNFFFTLICQYILSFLLSFLGKSSLTIQFVEGQFVDSYDPTIENSKYCSQGFINWEACVLHTNSHCLLLGTLIVGVMRVNHRFPAGVQKNSPKLDTFHTAWIFPQYPDLSI